MAIVTAPMSQSAMQNMAQDRAVRVFKLSPSNEALRREVKSLGQGFLDLRPIALYGPIVIGESFGNFDSNAGAVIRFEKRFEQRFAHVLANFGNRIDGGNAHVVIIVSEEQ